MKVFFSKGLLDVFFFSNTQEPFSFRVPNHRIFSVAPRTRSLPGAAADVPADLTEVDCCVDQWPPDVSVLAEVDGGPA